ncbi:MAG: glutamine amidotransferase [SAR202 cluster bacterium]|nr:glutamine amidotransferase [SAR202 cluster bacterium]
MCGISGLLYKNDRKRGQSSIGADLTKMLDSMAHRGKDSSGFTIGGEDIPDDYIIRVWTEDEEHAKDVLARAEESVAKVGGVVNTKHAVGQFLRMTVNYEGEVPDLAAALLKTKGVEVHSIGESSEVIKDVGTATDMDHKHHLSKYRGTHGIGHVRMATESKVDITHAHPFWAYPFPDITVVHNGQLTNYHKLKRHLEDNGHHFQTHNDSEIISVFLADTLSKGATLEEALKESLTALDGTFTYLVSTRDGIGCAKDKWAAKPLVIMETEDTVAIASEEVALRRVFSEEINRVEPQENEVMVWSV